MRIQIHVKPNSKKPGIEEGKDGQLIVRVRAPAVDGKANEAVIEALAKYFRVRRSSIAIIHGDKGRHKIVEVDSL